METYEYKVLELRPQSYTTVLMDEGAAGWQFVDWSPWKKPDDGRDAIFVRVIPEPT